MKLRDSVLVGFIEAILLTGEFAGCLILCTAFTRLVLFLHATALEYLSEVLHPGLYLLFSIPSSIICWSLSSFLVLLWMVKRHPSLVRTPIKPIPPWFGLSLRGFPSKTLVFVTLLLVCEFYGTIWWMYQEALLKGEKHDSLFDMLSLNIVMKPAAPVQAIDTISELIESLNFMRIFQIIILTPILEELMFRGLVTSMILNRPKTMTWKIIVLPSVLFGAFHLVNFASGKFPPVYILLQIFLGVVIGCFYSAHFLNTGNLFESMIMHGVNNFLSSLLPQNTSAFDLTKTSTIVQLTWTIFTYTALTYLSYSNIQKKLNKEKQM